MDIRAMLDEIAEYVAAKNNAEGFPDFISADQSEEQLNAIAQRFKAAMEAN